MPLRAIETEDQLKEQMLKARIEAYRLADRLDAIVESGLVPADRDANDLHDLTVCTARTLREALVSASKRISRFHRALYPMGEEEK